MSMSTAEKTESDSFLTNTKTRWTFNISPTEISENSSSILPFGCIFTPLGEFTGSQHVPCPPISCRHCHSVLSPLNNVDYHNRTWQCVFCNKRSGLPPTGSQVLTHTDSGNTFVVDYPINVQSAGCSHAVCLFVIDVCVSTEDELAALKEHILRSITILSPNTLIGLITFGATLELHEMNQEEAQSRSYAFRGSIEHSSAQILETLGPGPSIERFLSPIEHAEFLFSQHIERLECNTWPEIRHQRPIRCTGSAISLAEGVLDIFCSRRPARILAFLSGVCSEGPGRAVGLKKSELIRVHADIRRATNSGKYWTQSVGFYTTIMQKMVINSHTLDVCSASLDQTGIAEMKNCIECTGGYLLMVDTWRKGNLEQNLRNILSQEKDFCYNISIEAIASVDWKIMGAIGPFTGALRKSPSISSTEMGLGKTCQWVASRMDKETAIACYFELLTCTQGYRYVQYLVTYTNHLGDTFLRTVTIRHPTKKFSKPLDAGEHFDQEVAATLIARHASFLCETQSPDGVRRNLDTTLIKFVHRYAEFTPFEVNSLRLQQTISFFPIFMYHLRRSPFMITFNSSPDETANYRLQLCRSNVYHSILMIHPTLISYTINAPPRPIPLDEKYIEDRSILVLDTFFDVLVYYGPIIQSWRDSGYETKNNDFRMYCCLPLKKTLASIKNRHPFPQIIECTKGDPASRVLIHKLNSNDLEMQGEMKSVITDDISLQTFTGHLKQKVVNF